MTLIEEARSIATKRCHTCLTGINRALHKHRILHRAEVLRLTDKIDALDDKIHSAYHALQQEHKRYRALCKFYNKGKKHFQTLLTGEKQ